MSKLNGTKKLSKKETRKIVFEKLSSALGDYGGELKQKKVAKNLKKFSKLLAENIVKTAGKQNGKVKAVKGKSLATAEQNVAMPQSTQ
jgi:hypothetical protein